MRFRDHLREAFEDPDGGTSMTRVIAVEIAQVLCVCMIVMAFRDQLATIGLPFAAIVIADLFAVPLQALFRAVVAWLKSSQGGRLVEKLISKVSTAPLTIESSEPASAPGTVKTTTEVTPAMPMAEGEK